MSSTRKRKRGQTELEEATPPSSTRDQPSSKRRQARDSRLNTKKEISSEASTSISEDSIDPLQFWIETGTWRKEYFEQDNQVREDFKRGKSVEEPEQRNWSQIRDTKKPFQTTHAFNHLHHFLATEKSSSLCRKTSQSSIQTPSDQPPRESKSTQYNSPDYEIRLEQKGSYMREANDIDDGAKGEDMKKFCNTLLGRHQKLPQDTLFRDDLFKKTCEKVRNRNEAVVVQDITRLIVPSAQNLAIYGDKLLDHLYETVNEGWTSVAEYEGSVPQPDYSVGFARSAFTKEQLNKLKPFVGEPGFKVITYLMVTTQMYFPFLTCEVKSGAADLNIADRQNAQSMSVALRALIILFRSVKREKELDREILVFSISHDHRSVRIYGHYPVIEGDKTTFYRHPIHDFSFTALDGKEKWTAYRFVKNIYEHHSPKLHQRICSAIDDLPADINFDLSESILSGTQSPHQSNVGSMLEKVDSQSSLQDSHQLTRTTSFTPTAEPASKKPRNQRAVGQ
ncbi:MAG: hypothetical protein Q9193_003042 [Seirophora villosa]